MSGTIQNNSSFVSSTKENLTTKKTDIPLDVGYIVPETTFVRGNEYLSPMSSDYVRPTSTAYLQPDPIEINCKCLPNIEIQINYYTFTMDIGSN